ncbi:hypothetical protein [Roseobacter sp.]|uniref:hypothetical protein n=1 Tax=Roseobacter sp. TaxID=1907202 RepID=UPI0025D3D0D2|nr:hypothetical protein [Roseobacter sp.]
MMLLRLLLTLTLLVSAVFSGTPDAAQIGTGTDHIHLAEMADDIPPCCDAAADSAHSCHIPPALLPPVGSGASPSATAADTAVCRDFRLTGINLSVPPQPPRSV